MALFPDFSGKTLTIGANLAPVVACLEKIDGSAVVLASGDPLFFGIGRYLLRNLPEADLEQAEWTQLPRRAIRRVRNRGFILTVLATIGSVVALGGWGFAIGAVCAGWSVLHARQWWKHAAWAVTPHAVAYKSGWWTRRTSVVRFAKIQTVSVSSTPFDRRLGMARLQVDTAGAGKAGHRLSIPFLPFDAAAGLHGRLAAEAARVGFRW